MTFTATLHVFLTWAQAQIRTLGTNLGDVLTNKPEPAMQALICTAVTAALLWGILKIVKAVGK